MLELKGIAALSLDIHLTRFRAYSSSVRACASWYNGGRGRLVAARRSCPDGVSYC